VSAPRPRVVVVGAGFGGLAATRALAKVPVDVVLVDRQNYHGFWPLLYQVATAALSPDDVAYSVRGIFQRQRNLEVRMASVDDIDLEARELELDQGPALAYDHLILAAGSVSTDFGVPGVAQHAFPLKTVPDAVRLRHHVLRQFESACSHPSLMADGALTVVVAGGGPTGVEISGAMAELFGKVLAKDFRSNGEAAQARVVLVEPGDHLLNGFSARSQAQALRTLTKLGVEVRFHTSIAAVSEHAVELGDGTAIPTRTLVWGAGIKANPLAERLGLAPASGGRVPVEPDLSLPGHPEVFVIGDLALVTDDHGKPLPQLAPVASQGARHAVRSVRRRMRGEPTSSFRYRDKGSMATIGRRSAVAELPGGIRLGGTLGWLSWLGLHLAFLVGFRNRVVVMVSWGWNFLTSDRGSRVILETDGAASRGLSHGRPPSPASRRPAHARGLTPSSPRSLEKHVPKGGPYVESKARPFKPVRMAIYAIVTLTVIVTIAWMQHHYPPHQPLGALKVARFPASQRYPQLAYLYYGVVALIDATVIALVVRRSRRHRPSSVTTSSMPIEPRSSTAAA